MEKSEKLFENKTTYTKEMYLDFLKFHNKKYNFSYITYTVIWFIIFLCCVIYSFTSGLKNQGVLITIILIAFVAYRFIHPKMIVNKELKSDKISDNNSNTFSFYKNYMEISNKNGSFTYKYFMIRKAFETKDTFYLYVTKENAFLISKNTFSLGTPEDFSKFLKSKFGIKYKKCKN